MAYDCKILFVYGWRPTLRIHHSKRIIFLCVGKRETTSENSCIELCTDRGTRLSANREVNRLPKYAQTAFLQISWFSDCVFEKVWNTIVNSICICLKTNLKNTPFETNYIPMRM